MTITLIWRGVDRNGEPLPEPKGFGEPFESPHWIPSTGDVIDARGTTVYVQGVKVSIAPGVPLHCDAYVVPVAQ
jgi:hypothetical protein